MNEINQIAKELGELVTDKNKAYGNSFAESGKILKILYPDGIDPEQYTDILLITRIMDKLFRIANQKKAFNESPYRDISGYGILGVLKDRKKTNEKVKVKEKLIDDKKEDYIIAQRFSPTENKGNSD